jgi:drug/metabolite transporter (DMT)-like permease
MFFWHPRNNEDTMLAVQTLSRTGRTDVRAAGGLVATAFIWGSLVPIIGMLRNTYDPLTILLLRYLPALPILILAVIVAERRWPWAGRVPWARLLFVAVAMLGFSTSHTLGLLLSDPITAAVVLSFGPLTAALVVKVLTGAALPRGLGIAMTLAIAGGALVVTGMGGSRLGGPRGGEPLLIASQICWTWYTVKAQAWLAPRGFSQLRIATVTSSVASGLLISIYAIVLLSGTLSLPALTAEPTHLALILWAGIAGSGVGLLFWNVGASRLGVPTASLYLNLIPVFAVLIATVFGASMSLQQVLGGMLVIAGVAQMQARALTGRRDDDSGRPSSRTTGGSKPHAG